MHYAHELLRGKISVGERRIKKNILTDKQSFHIVPQLPAAHMCKHKMSRVHVVNHFTRHLWSTVHGFRQTDVYSRMNYGDEIIFFRFRNNALVAIIVEVHLLIVGVQFDSLEPTQCNVFYHRRNVDRVGVDAGERNDARISCRTGYLFCLHTVFLHAVCTSSRSDRHTVCCIPCIHLCGEIVEVVCF